jgi:hypothetical protein
MLLQAAASSATGLGDVGASTEQPFETYSPTLTEARLNADALSTNLHAANVNCDTTNTGGDHTDNATAISPPLITATLLLPHATLPMKGLINAAAPPPAQGVVNNSAAAEAAAARIESLLAAMPGQETAVPVGREPSDDTTALLQAHDGISNSKAARLDRMSAVLAGLDGHLTTADAEKTHIIDQVSNTPKGGSPASTRAKTAATLAAASFSATKKMQMDKAALQRKMDMARAQSLVGESETVMIKAWCSYL